MTPAPARRITSRTPISRHVLDPVIFPITYKFQFYPLVGTPPSPFQLLAILYNSSFSSDSHAWSAAPIQFIWTCLYTIVAFKITIILFFPEGTLQLTLHDSTAVHFHYRSTQWTVFVLFLYQLPYIPTSNRWNRIRYLNINRYLRNLYKASRTFRKQATQAEDHIPPVSAPPVNGRTG